VRDARERLNALADAVLGDVKIRGRQIGDPTSVPVADDDVYQDRGGRRGIRARRLDGTRLSGEAGGPEDRREQCGDAGDARSRHGGHPRFVSR
jgi:hypothetical protein